nr:hypothetical protein [Kofleriaceae bacterium]
MSVHRFRPRYGKMAWASIGVGVPVAALGAIAAVIVPIGFGALAIGAGAMYLASPAWRLEVVVDDSGLEVRTPKASRFKLAWSDVVKVIASPTTGTCFVDGGAPERSVLVPGVGAPAPYDLADKPALFEAIVAHVPADRVTTVERLELYKR